MEGVRTTNGVLWNCTRMPALILDLDGTVRYSKSGGFIKGPDDIALFDGVEQKIQEYRYNGYLIFAVSNQAGVAYGYRTWEDVDAELSATLALFDNKDLFHFCKQCYAHPEGTVVPYNYRSLFRKPNIGMLAEIEVECYDEGYIVDWDNSIFVGDRPEDEQCAKNAGTKFQWAKEFFGRE